MPTMSITSWFQVGWSTDLEVGDVRPLHYFGQDLVAFRDRSGRFCVLDAHCRHLGANLAFGGCVTDEGIQCPFHGWVWRADGTNASVPYQDRPSKVRLRAWHTAEADGVLLVWHDAEGRAPLWSPPASLREVAPHLIDKDFHPAGPTAQSRFPGTHVHPQMVLENAVDPVHFRFVHKTPDIPRVVHEDIDDWTWHSKVGFGRRWSDGIDRPDDQAGTLHLLWSGTGIAYNALTDGERVMMVLIAATPVDDETTDVFGTYWPERLADDEQTQRHLAYVEQAKQALPDDLVIWEHQRYLTRPALATEEGRHWIRLREWSQKFYPAGSDGPLGPVPART
jgi:phenylpropionate dioxygenase-like ring-hydroxylating dioxygenase large terminal subunit